MSEVIVDSLTWTDFAGPQKVDHVCSYMLRELLLLLNEGKHEALNPILCCYAKPNPPLLEDALTCISTHFIGNTALNRAATLASPKVQSAIKYLAFLAEGQKLFEAAIGQYDFVMARAVARQCQMDPKHYSPLLERFEAITSTQGSPGLLISGGLEAYREAVMKFEVNLHLKRYTKCVECGTLALKEHYLTLHNTQLQVSQDINSDALLEGIYKLTHEHSLQLLAISLLEPLLSLIKHTPAGPHATGLTASIRGLLNKTHLSYGQVCVSKQLYDEAVVSFLATSPPSYTPAILAAKQNADWQLTLSLTGREAIAEKANVALKLKRVAIEIVTAFRASLEQGDEDLGDVVSSVLPSYLAKREHINETFNYLTKTGPTRSPVAKASSGDRALEAAQISLDYCQDAETAVAILLLARKWVPAIQIAVRSQRLDLLTEEVCLLLHNSLPSFNQFYDNYVYRLL